MVRLRLTTVCVLLALLLPWRGSAQTSTPLVVGMDHIPVVVADLERAEADFHAMGFSLKPGRTHTDGIRNAHDKFPAGTEIELITAPAAVDALTAEYRAKLRDGEGPVYFGLYAPDRVALAAKLGALGFPIHNDGALLDFPPENPLHPLFFGNRNKSPTDKPEHFAHANTAERLSALWVNDSQPLRALLQGLGIVMTPMPPSNPLCDFKGTVATLPDGNLYLVPSASANVLVAKMRIVLHWAALIRREISTDFYGANHVSRTAQSGNAVARQATCQTNDG